MGYQVIEDSDIIDGLSVRYLKIFGIWKVINDYRTSEKRNYILKFQLIITLVLAIPSIIPQYFSFLVIQVDIQKATILNFHSLPSLQVLCKLLVFWFRIDSLCKLYNLMTKDFLDKTIPDCEIESVKHIYTKMSKRTNIIVLTACIVINCGVFLLVLFPSISVDYILYHTGNMYEVTTGRKKISTGWYPLPMDKSPWYEIILVYEGLVVLWAGSFIFVFMCLYYQLLMCLHAQFIVLGSHVSTLKIESLFEELEATDRIKNVEMYKKLYRILQDHQKLISFADELRTVYNPLVTMILGMGISVLIIAVFQFLLGKTGDPMFILRSFMFLLYQCIEVSMFCYSSSFIETASSDLHFAIYSSDWYKAGTKFRKAAQMMMIRARKGVTLTAIRMYPINLETIMAILQFTYTVATLISRFTE
ncbi:odorant receptor 4-like [Halyomorpha halys]|uniref:odorant receptor 4-like n=1 Tax=Halyomorpha halys TaxID=286706 RepID=UPI000D0C905F|nr:odorant receptor 63a-like [Halyomorpha halys]KAE8573623.1 Odorant receptor 46 [Halyomorpha halys]